MTYEMLLEKAMEMLAEHCSDLCITLSGAI